MASHAATSQPEKTTPVDSAAQKDSALLEVRIAPAEHRKPRTRRYRGLHRRRLDTSTV